MRTVKKIEEAIKRLAPDELADFRRWFTEFDAAIWDEQIERDVVAGRLDGLAEEALRDFREGNCSDLNRGPAPPI